MTKKMLTSAVLAATVLGTSAVTFAAENPFTSIPRDHWAYDAVTKLVDDGIIDGYGDTDFRGDRPITRYEMAQLVSKAVENQEKARAVDKAAIDALKAEFGKDLKSDLTSLKKDVADLKSRMGWYGDIRLRYFQNKNMKSVDRDDPNYHGSSGRATQFEKRVRLGFWTQMNDPHWSAEGRLKYEDNSDAYDAWTSSSSPADGQHLNTWDNSYNNQNSFRLERACLNYNNKDFGASIGRTELSLGNGLLWWENPIDGVILKYQFSPKVSAKLGYGDLSAEGWDDSRMWASFGEIDVQTSPATRINLDFLHTNSDLYHTNVTKGLADGWYQDAQGNWQQGRVYKETTSYDKKDYRLNQIALGIDTQLADKWNLKVEGVVNNVSSSSNEPLNKHGVWSQLTYGNLVWNKAHTWKIVGEYFAMGNAAMDSKFWGHHLNFAAGNSNWSDNNYWGDGARGWGLGAEYQIIANTNIQLYYYWIKPYDEAAAGFSKYNDVVLAALTWSF